MQVYLLESSQGVIMGRGMTPLFCKKIKQLQTLLRLGFVAVFYWNPSLNPSRD